LTDLATEAVQHRPGLNLEGNPAGVNLEGYPDYRGVPSFGAWTWLPQYEFAVATEVDIAEAYRSLAALERAFWILFGLLAASAVALFWFTWYYERLRVSMRKAELAAQQLGQYTLEEKIGAGGMGMVYRARHALLRRPTAVKLLDPERTNDAAIARFEREVQLTCRLTHPNTIAIYDYGRTPQGVFYYAMEYIDGTTLEKLVAKSGPLPDGRVCYILAQVCGSLIEAHEAGLIHRDIKPANIMLTRRGALADFVKLLDFGLAKALDANREAGLTAAGTVTGTPIYVSPEAIEHPDKVGPLSDLYSVGAVAYFLLCGKPVFDGPNILEICRKQVHVSPAPPSQKLGQPIAADLEALVLSCLAKHPEDRPGSVREFASRLARCQVAVPWTAEQAEAWWQNDRTTIAAGKTTTSEWTYSTLDPNNSRPVTFATLDPSEAFGHKRRLRSSGAAAAKDKGPTP
jgi:serine/threonine protein kinase